MSKTIQDHFVSRMDHAVSKTVACRGILLNLDNGAYFDMNAVGVAVWKLCNGKKRTQDIALAVSKKFRMEKSRVSKDVLQFISELKRQRLVRITLKPVCIAKKASRSERNLA